MENLLLAIGLVFLSSHVLIHLIFQSIKFEKEMKALQKQFTANIQGLCFLSLSAQLRDMREINPDNPNLEDLITSANLIELLALAYFEGWVNEWRVLQIWGDQVSTVFGQIYYAKDGVGKAILKTMPMAIKLHEHIALHKGSTATLAF